MESKPDAPKRPMNATFLYMNEKRDDYRKKHPEAKIGDIAKALSSEYAKLSDKEKEKYLKQYEAGKVDYEKVSLALL